MLIGELILKLNRTPPLRLYQGTIHLKSPFLIFDTHFTGLYVDFCTCGIISSWITGLIGHEHEYLNFSLYMYTYSCFCLLCKHYGYAARNQVFGTSVVRRRNVPITSLHPSVRFPVCNK
jgi:hypothetical protein